MTALGPNLIIRADISEKVSQGGIIIAAASTREARAPESVEVVMLGEQAFDDLEVIKPKVGDIVAIARYDGKIIQESTENGKDYEYRVIADTRILAILEDVKTIDVQSIEETTDVR